MSKIYPDGIHGRLAEHLGEQGFTVRTATLDEPEHGLTDEMLNQTDVLTWWGHHAHDEVSDETVDRVQSRVLEGMGLIVLHSVDFSKIFKRLMGTTCNLKWREVGERERVWVVEPGHPITAGIGQYFEIPKSEMYGERFDIPAPGTLVFACWYQGGEIFRSGCCFRRGRGQGYFYFWPGHETFPIYHQPEVLRVITNANFWATPVAGAKVKFGQAPRPIESIG